MKNKHLITSALNIIHQNPDLYTQWHWSYNGKYCLGGLILLIAGEWNGLDFGDKLSNHLTKAETLAVLLDLDIDEHIYPLICAFNKISDIESLLWKAGYREHHPLFKSYDI